MLGIGGTLRDGSSSELALRFALAAAAAAGTETIMIGAKGLELPMYSPGVTERAPAAQALIDAFARADAIIIASPGYHGGPSGLVKNALDYTEDLRDAERPYLDGRPVGCIVCAHGWQATTTTLVALRSIVHALRGWPTPLGVAINSAEGSFSKDGKITNEAVSKQLQIVGEQVAQFARRWTAGS